VRTDITGRHIDITPPIQQLIDKSLGRIERLLNDRAVSATVILTKEKYRHRTEIVIHARGDQLLSGNGEGNSWPLSLRSATTKIEQQARKLKTRWTDSKRKRDGAGASAAEAIEDRVRPTAAPVVRPARYPVKPMSIEDAALRLEAGREMFVVFRNAETDAVGILYRRKDGNLALIEPE
jgi:putative sigma-54 modulation protein